MKPEKIYYEFVNSQTGNVIAYLTLPVSMDDDERQAKLEKKRAEFAIANGLLVELIFWQDHDHPIQ